MKLSIIVVSYNTAQVLMDCIASIYGNRGDLDCEIIVVDNNSSDDSVALVKERFPTVRVLSNNYNAGFARANNQGFAMSTGEYVLLLNSDTVIKGDAIQRMVRCLGTYPDIALVGPRLLNPDLSLQAQCRRGFPRLLNSLAYVTGLNKVFPGSRIMGGYLLSYLDDRTSHEVDAVSGACLLVRRNIIDEIGGLLDEAFFMHFEDIDLCFRIKKRNCKVWYLHDAEVIHLKGQSSKFRAKGVKINFYDSALIYLAKNYREESWCGYIVLSTGIRGVRRLFR